VAPRAAEEPTADAQPAAATAAHRVQIVETAVAHEKYPPQLSAPHSLGLWRRELRRIFLVSDCGLHDLNPMSCCSGCGLPSRSSAGLIEYGVHPVTDSIPAKHYRPPVSPGVSDDAGVKL
jgi:hypothetical protein